MTVTTQPDWVLLIRIMIGSIDALITTYAAVRAWSFVGANRYMRLTLSSFAAVLTYSQFKLAIEPIPLTDRTYVGWVGSVVALALLLAAIRADMRASTPRRRGASR